MLNNTSVSLQHYAGRNKFIAPTMHLTLKSLKKQGACDGKISPVHVGVLLYADAMENYWLAHALLSGDKNKFDEPEEILGADTAPDKITIMIHTWRYNIPFALSANAIESNIAFVRAALMPTGVLPVQIYHAALGTGLIRNPAARFPSRGHFN
jgi:hypothetical protein